MSNGILYTNGATVDGFLREGIRNEYGLCILGDGVDLDQSKRLRDQLPDAIILQDVNLNAIKPWSKMPQWMRANPLRRITYDLDARLAYHFQDWQFMGDEKRTAYHGKARLAPLDDKRGDKDGDGVIEPHERSERARYIHDVMNLVREYAELTRGIVDGIWGEWSPFLSRGWMGKDLIPDFDEERWVTGASRLWRRIGHMHQRVPGFVYGCNNITPSIWPIDRADVLTQNLALDVVKIELSPLRSIHKNDLLDEATDARLRGPRWWADRGMIVAVEVWDHGSAMPNDAYWPHAKAVVADLRAKGARVFLSRYPYISKGSRGWPNHRVLPEVG